MKVCLAIGLSFVFGAILGAYLSRPASVRAEAGNVVHLTKLKMDALKEPQSIPGEVVGFSCVSPNAGTQYCFVLSR